MLVRRVSAVILALTLVSGNVAICAGWALTPEARMACCAEGAECPMHKSDSSDDSGRQSVTQAQADSCCAMSEGRQPGPSAPTFTVVIPATVLTVAALLPAETTPRILRESGRRPPPLHADVVPKHVLLSVFLV